MDDKTVKKGFYTKLHSVYFTVQAVLGVCALFGMFASAIGIDAGIVVGFCGVLASVVVNMVVKITLIWKE